MPGAYSPNLSIAMESRARLSSTTLAFHASRIVIDLGVLFVLASLSLTYVAAPGGDRSAMALDALPALLLVAPIFAVTLLPDHTRPLPPARGLGALVLGLAAFPYAVVKYFDAVVLADTLGGSLALGVRLLVFGAFVVIVGVVIGLLRSWMGLSSGGSPTRSTARPQRSPEQPLTAAEQSRAPPPPEPWRNQAHSVTRSSTLSRYPRSATTNHRRVGSRVSSTTARPIASPSRHPTTRGIGPPVPDRAPLASGHDLRSGRRGSCDALSLRHAAGSRHPQRRRCRGLASVDPPVACRARRCDR